MTMRQLRMTRESPAKKLITDINAQMHKLVPSSQQQKVSTGRQELDQMAMMIPITHIPLNNLRLYDSISYECDCEMGCDEQHDDLNKSLITRAMILFSRNDSLVKRIQQVKKNIKLEKQKKGNLLCKIGRNKKEIDKLQQLLDSTASKTNIKDIKIDLKSRQAVSRTQLQPSTSVERWKNKSQSLNSKMKNQSGQSYQRLTIKDLQSMKSYRLDSTRNSNTWQKDKSLWETDQTEIEVKDNKAKIGTKCKRIPAGQPKNKPQQSGRGNRSLAPSRGEIGQTLILSKRQQLLTTNKYLKSLSSRPQTIPLFKRNPQQ